MLLEPTGIVTAGERTDFVFEDGFFFGLLGERVVGGVGELNLNLLMLMFALS